MRSRFNFFIVILPCIFIVVLFGLGWYFALHPEIRLRNKGGGTSSAIIPGIILIVGTGFMLFVLLKRIVWLKIERDQLLIRGVFFRQDLLLDWIKDIQLLDRKIMSYSNFKYEAMTIRTVDEREFVFYDLYYWNMREMRVCLQEWYRGLVTPGSFKDRPVVPVSEPETFAGNFILSPNGIFIFVFAALAAWAGMMLLPRALHGGALLLVLCFLWLFLGFMLVMFSKELHYFHLEGDELQVRNHVWFWYKKSYPLVDIVGIVFESPYKRSDRLRVRTRDLRSDGYGAGSLRKRHWKALYERLRSLDIPVILEFNIGKTDIRDSGDGGAGGPAVAEPSADWRSTD